MDQLPADWRDAALLGRILTPRGPSPVLVLRGRVFDISRLWPTTAEFVSAGAPLDLGRGVEDLGGLEDLRLEPVWEAPDADVRLLSPLDLQCVKAAGVTFAVSTLERVIEERARGDAGRAEALRSALAEHIGAEIGAVRPGTPQAAELKAALIAEGLWSQYLEVAIGPDAEVFTKAPCLSTVGWGDYVGVRSDSHWNNPEPEIVLACGRDGVARGAALGNDVNLRDFEGRSALLLGKAKDNNASCAVGPFIRLFDGGFTIDDVRQAAVHLEVVGEDNFRLEGTSSMARISRDPLELVGQTIGKHHQYPDGFALFLGTMFAPIEDRDVPGQGFTHKPGDIVRVSNPRLGVLENRVTTCDQAPPWRFGISDLMRNLAGRGLLRAPWGPSMPDASAIYPSLRGKRVVVTGGGSGIGAALVEAFVRQGAEVAFLDVLEQESEALAKRLAGQGASPRFYPCDLTDLQALKSALARIEADLGPVQVLVNNAANDDRHRLDEVTPEYWDRSLATNLRHMLFCAQAVVPGMRAAGGGAIINFGSISWHLGLPDLVLYETAKAGIEGMTRALARELGPDGIRVTCVAPGNIKTPRQMKWYTPEGEAEIVAAQCLKARIHPEHVASLVLFLASDDAGMCTGHEYWIDAGWR